VQVGTQALSKNCGREATEDAEEISALRFEQLGLGSDNLVATVKNRVTGKIRRHPSFKLKK
jgi:hypothetical protein